MKLCPNAGATLEETRSSSEQVTGETVSYSVCEGPGSLLKTGGRIMDQSLFRDTQLDPGDSALSLWSWPLQTQTCFYSEHIIHWFILWGFSLELHMFVAGLLLCVWGSNLLWNVLVHVPPGRLRLSCGSGHAALLDIQGLVYFLLALISVYSRTQWNDLSHQLQCLSVEIVTNTNICNTSCSLPVSK